MRAFTQPSIAAVQAKAKGARELVTIFESIEEMATYSQTAIDDRKIDEAEASSWSDNTSTSQAIRMLHSGAPNRTEASDKLLASLEQYLEIKSSRFRVIDDVAGGAPNIPAYLAGQPLAMRRRQRVTDEQAPLTVIADLSSSASVSARELQNRGAAILALVRTMAIKRPVKLYAAITAGHHGSNGGKDAIRVLLPIETAPLDVARAAYILAHAGLPRALGYRLAYHLSGNQWNGSVPWCYNSADVERATQTDTYRHLLDCADILAIPAPHTNDASISNPQKWLADTLAKFSPQQQAA